MDRIHRMLTGMGGPGGQGGPPGDTPQVDTAEQIYISSLALLKMLKHGRAGVPMEVMGLMLGRWRMGGCVLLLLLPQDFFMDGSGMPPHGAAEYAARLAVAAWLLAPPVGLAAVFTYLVMLAVQSGQSGTGVSVEAVDPVFQTKMLDMLKQVGRPEMVVGWYHSHPGFGCWLSGVDINTQQSFEALNQRAVAVVVDPVQSVKGKVVIDAFRLISPARGAAAVKTGMMIREGQRPPSGSRKNELEELMLLNLSKKTWTQGLLLQDYAQHASSNDKVVSDMKDLVSHYDAAVVEEQELPPEKRIVANVGKMDAKKHLASNVTQLMSSNINQAMGTMLDTMVF
eukprot:gene6925-7143_t